MGIVGVMQDKVRGIIADPRHRAVTFWIACFKPGGIGDYLTLCAFARAAGRHWEARLGARGESDDGDCEVRATWARPEPARERRGETVGVLCIGRECGLPLDYDKVHGQPGINAHFQMPEIGWAFQASKLAPLVDVLYDVRYTAREIIRDKERFATEDADARDRLDYYRAYYDFFPWSSQYLEGRVGMSQWDLLSETAGFPVTPDDLFVATNAVVMGDHGLSTLPASPLLDGCVTIHNGEGGTGKTKLLPRDVPTAIAAALIAEGIPVAQVGVRDDKKEPMTRGVMDLRGLRLPETAAVIQKARMHVDVEGGLVYVARAVQTPSVVFFGPTPRSFFAFYGNANYTRGICPFREDSRHCWWSTRNWAKRCPLGFKNCVNLPQAETATRMVMNALHSQGGARIEMQKQRVGSG